MHKYNPLQSATCLTRLLLSLSLAVGMHSARVPSTLANSENFQELHHDYEISKSKLREANTGNWNWDWLTPGNKLDAYYSQKKNWLETGKIREEHLYVLKKVLGDTNPNVASAMISLADIKLKQGQLTEAKELLGKALSIKKLAPSYSYSDQSNINRGLANVALHEGNINRAEALLRQNYESAREEDKAKIKVIHLPLALVDLAQFLQNQKQNQKAIQLYQELLTMNMSAHAYPTAVQGLESYLAILAQSERKEDSLKVRKKIKEFKKTISQLNKPGLDY